MPKDLYAVVTKALRIPHHRFYSTLHNIFITEAQVSEFREQIL